jgi:adenine-specific DNA methylase
MSEMSESRRRREEGARAALRPAREVLEEIEERGRREECEAADAFVAVMDDALSRYGRGQPMRLQVGQAHVSLAVEMLVEAGYHYKIAASHPADGGQVVLIEVSFAEHHTVTETVKDEISRSDGRERNSEPEEQLAARDGVILTLAEARQLLALVRIDVSTIVNMPNYCGGIPAVVRRLEAMIAERGKNADQ